MLIVFFEDAINVVIGIDLTLFQQFKVIEKRIRDELFGQICPAKHSCSIDDANKVLVHR